MNRLIKFHAIGDPHISKRHISLSQEAIAGTIKLLEKRVDVDIVTIMGDILDRHDDVKLTYQRMAIDWINRLVKVINDRRSNTIVAVLIGNHDRPSNQDFFSETHPFMGMNDIAGRLYIVNKPKAVSVNGQKVLFMPYLPPGRFIEGFNTYLGLMHQHSKWLSIQGINDFSLIFAHQEFKGAPYGPITSSKGDVWPNDYPIVVSGHIHTRVWLQDNILYTGSLYPITTAESNDKGVVCGSYNPSTNRIEYTTVRVVSTEKVVLHIDAKDDDAIREMVTLDREHTKYIIRGTSMDIASIKNRIRSTNKDINIAYDIRVEEPSTIRSNTSIEYNDIVRKKAEEASISYLLEEIIA